MLTILTTDAEGGIVGISRFENSEDFLDAHQEPNTFVIDGTLDIPDLEAFEAYKVVGGAVHDAGPRPSTHHFWKLASLSWEIDLSVAKAGKRAAIKRQRDSIEFAPFTYNGMIFDGDVNAQRRLSGVVSAAKSAIAVGQTFTKEFTLADNSVVQLSAEDFIGIEMAKIWQVDVAFQEYRLKRAAIEAATTLEELEAVVPTT